MHPNVITSHDGLSGLNGKSVPPLYDVSGSIVAYNSDPDKLQKAIHCFLATPLRVSLMVIDNSPQAALQSVVEQTGCGYLYLGKNVGFGAGHNIALRRYLRESRYHLVLNPDVYWEVSVLERLFSFMEESPGAGLTMPRVLYPDGTFQPLCKRLPTPVDLFARRFAGKAAFRSLVDRLMQQYELRDLDFERVQSVPFLSGCFMFLRTDALRDIGLFDNRYFLYLEDVDLCRRMAQNWDTLYYPHVHIYHEYAKASYTDSALRNHHIRSAILYFNKWGWVFDSERDRINSKRGQGEFHRELARSRASGQ